MAFITLTKINGGALIVNSNLVTSVTEIKQEYEKGLVTTVYFADEDYWQVKESLAIVLHLLENA